MADQGLSRSVSCWVDGFEAPDKSGGGKRSLPRVERSFANFGRFSAAARRISEGDAQGIGVVAGALIQGEDAPGQSRHAGDGNESISI